MATDRIKPLRHDFDLVQRHFSSMKNCPFKRFSFTDTCCHFSFVDGIITKEYYLQTNDNYPHDSVLTLKNKSVGQNCRTETKSYSVRFPRIINSIGKEMGFRCNFNGGLSSDEESSDDDYDDHFVDPEFEPESEMNPLLLRELHNVRALFGENYVHESKLQLLGTMDIELRLSLQVLDVQIAKAWSLDPTEPLLLRLEFSWSQYLNGKEPSLRVVHKSSNEIGVLIQLEKILQTFISSRWGGMLNEDVERNCRTVGEHEKAMNYVSDSEGLGAYSFGESLDPKLPCTKDCPMKKPVNDGAVAQVIDMGFDINEAKIALKLTGNDDVNKAVSLLVAAKEKCVRWSTHVCQQERSYCDSFSYVKSLVSKILNGQLEKPKDAKEVPSLEHGFLVQLVHYTYQRLLTLNEYCVICDEKHAFANVGMLKPTVCRRSLCVFSFQTLGVMSKAANSVATCSTVIDLLINMAKAACKSSRAKVIFTPFPTIYDTKNQEKILLDQSMGVSKCIEIFDAFPSMKEMASYDAVQLKTELDKRHALAFPLLQWIISSNLCHIVKLPHKKQLKFMQTPHQFLLVSSSPAKEAIFRQAKQKQGSIFAFHGSPLENWHSIMRSGLINATGTEYQVHGDVYGKGIYLSPASKTSFNYCRYSGQPRLPSWNPAMAGSNSSLEVFLPNTDLYCIALCEVIESPALNRNTGSSDIWVLQDGDHVTTRFFFVYEGHVPSSPIDTRTRTVLKEIRTAVDFNYS